jgi:hypothetical protein
VRFTCHEALGAFTSTRVKVDLRMYLTVTILSVEAELKRAVKRLNMMLLVLAVELIPITLLAIFVLTMLLSHPIVPSGD